MRWFAIRAQQIRDGGRLTGWCGSASDIDDCRLAADNLTDRDVLLRRFFESEAILMWVGDVATRQIEPFDSESRGAWALPQEGPAIRWDA